MRLYALLFAIGLVVYGALAGSRITKQSQAPQFVYQADAWLHGQVHVDPPLVDNDWAKLDTVELADGRLVRGKRMVTRPAFRALDGELIPMPQVKAVRETTWYMSFPPLPTLLMVPSALISGRAGNDVIPTLLVAAAILPLCLLLLRRLAAAGLSQRSVREDLWLVGALAFGSVLFFSAVQGKVWYTAHVVGVALALVYAWASIEAKRPIVAGLALGAAALTRTPMAFMFPLFVAEAWRMAGGDRRVLVRSLVRFAAPVAGFAIAGMVYNYVRFGSPTEFGHTYLEVRQAPQIEQWGLMSYHYLSRNLTVALALLPELPGRAPWIQIGGHGLALWFTTPLLLFVLWPCEKPSIHRALWLTIALVAVPVLLYQNSGWVQFGYRFSLDYMVFLIMLIAIGGRPLTRVAKSLIIAGVVINLFGAWTFDRKWQYYRVGGDAYDVIIRH
ncbi:MAG TPA: hypothetical protein VFS15_09045 [Kofleriaceae bacterium]|nr:hypothetical protein [Kofleriaceae bacterium]